MPTIYRATVEAVSFDPTQDVGPSISFEMEALGTTRSLASDAVMELVEGSDHMHVPDWSLGPVVTVVEHAECGDCGEETQASELVVWDEDDIGACVRCAGCQALADAVTL